MTTITAKVIADSISEHGHRLTTLELHYPRIILAELNTHRQLSKNTSSSRAIPVEKIIKNVIDDPYIPLKWGLNESGMYSSQFANADISAQAKEEWLRARDRAIESAKFLRNDLGLHKQFVNRLLEPWSHVNTVISGTDWNNFFKLRVSNFAQPEIKELAIAIMIAINDSSPKLISNGEYHLPYITEEDKENVSELNNLIKMSVARCARVSYKSNATGKNSTLKEDIVRYDSLKSNGHMSPFEHVATPNSDYFIDNIRSNYTGWIQLRKQIEVPKINYSRSEVVPNISSFQIKPNWSNQ